MTSKCGRCRRKLVHKKSRYLAADGSKFSACTCGLQWVVQHFATGWRSPRVTRLKAAPGEPDHG